MEQKIGILDIETSNLKADYGFIFSYAIKELNGKVYKRCITREELWRGVYDKYLLQDIMSKMGKFGRLVTFYGSKFDIPFVRTRCLRQGITGFPEPGSIKHTDLFYTMRYKFKLSRSSLENSCKFFGIAAKKHRMEPQQWWDANTGRKWALDWIMTHNVEDVVSTERLFKKVLPYIKLRNAPL